MTNKKVQHIEQWCHSNISLDGIGVAETGHLNWRQILQENKF